MKHNRIKPSGNIEADVIKAIKRFAREEYGFQPARMTKNKKKYDRKVEKTKLLRDSEAYFLYTKIIFKEPERWNKGTFILKTEHSLQEDLKE